MGGDRHYPYPRWVWSPAGGWWVNPRHWRTSLAIVVTGVAATSYAIYNYGSERESYIHRADQSVHYAQKDARRRWAIKEAREKQQAQLDYQKEHGQRPASAHYD